MRKIVFEALLRKSGFRNDPLAAISHTTIAAFCGTRVPFAKRFAYTNSPIDRIPIGSRLVNGSPYRTPIVLPQ